MTCAEKAMRLTISFLFLAFVGCAQHHAISGSVIDRNGEPLDRVIISVDPGSVEMLSDEHGMFIVDYLRDDVGERVKLERRTDYELTVFKPGYHEAKTRFYFKRGELLLEPVTMRADTIRIDAADDNIDPGLYPDRAQNNGAAYEGE